MTVIAGIDPSLTATAVVLSDPAAGPEGYKLRVFGSKNLGDEVRARFTRFEDMVGRITSYLAENGVKEIFLESYSFASKFNVTLLAEFGGVLRWNLLDVGEVYEIAPSTLKKFVTGAGNTKGKDLLAACVVQRWGVMLDSSDAFDAYSAWRLGRCALAIDEPANDAQREAVAKVMGLEMPKVKQPRKKPEPKPF